MCQAYFDSYFMDLQMIKNPALKYAKYYFQKLDNCVSLDRYENDHALLQLESVHYILVHIGPLAFTI